MNELDFRYKEYIRVNNNNDDPLSGYQKAIFLTSFVVTGDRNYSLPVTANAFAILKANEYLFSMAADFCTNYYSDANGYACYVSEMGVINIEDGLNVPYAKVNVYNIYGEAIVS